MRINPEDIFETTSVDPPEREIEKSDERCPFLRVIAEESEAGITTALRLKCGHTYLRQYPEMLEMLSSYRSLTRLLLLMADPPQDEERLVRYNEAKRVAQEMHDHVDTLDMSYDELLPRS